MQMGGVETALRKLECRGFNGAHFRYRIKRNADRSKPCIRCSSDACEKRGKRWISANGMDFVHISKIVRDACHLPVGKDTAQSKRFNLAVPYWKDSVVDEMQNFGCADERPKAVCEGSYWNGMDRGWSSTFCSSNGGQSRGHMCLIDTNYSGHPAVYHRRELIEPVEANGSWRSRKTSDVGIGREVRDCTQINWDKVAMDMRDRRLQIYEVH